MQLRLRATLAAVAALSAGAATMTAPAASVQASSPVTIVHACSQSVPVGRFACQALRQSHHGDVASNRRSSSARAKPAGYGPADLKAAYKLPTANGKGRRVYIVDAFDDPKAESDLAKYRSTYGLPPCTTKNGCFKKLNQNGQPRPLPRADKGWAGEISLDLDMVSAACPKCSITLIEARSDDQNLFVAVHRAVALGAKYVSMSFGGPEDGTEPDFDAAYFAKSGVVYTASTGDSGYIAGASYPATSPRVVAVGGTSLRRASNSRGWAETAWRGAGSGCSSNEPKPSWQQGVTACSRRGTADVAAVADPNTGVAVYQTYGGSGWAVYGGTSAAAPIIAAVYALHGKPAASALPGRYPYAHRNKLFDVTSGANGASCSPSRLCKAGRGWDGPTGLGTPNGAGALGA